MAKRKKDISEFGEYLVERIDEAKMSKSEFYLAVGIQKPYFYEILSGIAPPQDTLEKMIQVIEAKLGPDEKRKTTFYNLAAKSRNEIPADISDLIRDRPDDWDKIRVNLKALVAEQSSDIMIGGRKNDE